MKFRTHRPEKVQIGFSLYEISMIDQAITILNKRLGTELTRKEFILRSCKASANRVIKVEGNEIDFLKD